MHILHFPDPQSPPDPGTHQTHGAHQSRGAHTTHKFVQFWHKMVGPKIHWHEQMVNKWHPPPSPPSSALVLHPPKLVNSLMVQENIWLRFFFGFCCKKVLDLVLTNLYQKVSKAVSNKFGKKPWNWYRSDIGFCHTHTQCSFAKLAWKDVHKQAIYWWTIHISDDDWKDVFCPKWATHPATIHNMLDST